jgi:hypothetical protein
MVLVGFMRRISCPPLYASCGGRALAGRRDKTRKIRVARGGDGGRMRGSVVAEVR